MAVTSSLGKVRKVLTSRVDVRLRDGMPYWWYVRVCQKECGDLDFALPSEYEKDIRSFWAKHLGVRVSTLGYRYFFAAHKVADVNYIPQDIFSKYLLRKLNRLEFARAYSDKNVYEKLFPGIETPTTVVRNIAGRFFDRWYRHISKENAVALIIEALSENRLVIKPAIDSGRGKNVTLIDPKDLQEGGAISRNAVDHVLDGYSCDYVVQLFFRQHDLLNRVYPFSLNTLRVVTFDDNGDIRVLARVLKMGNNSGFLDKVSLGGLSCAIGPDGALARYAYGSDVQRPVTSHPQTGFTFEGTRIPHFEAVLSLATELHREICQYFRFVSWDLAVGLDGRPELVEANLKSPGVMISQLNCGPLFGNDTVRILEEIGRP